MNTWIIGMTCFVVGFGIAWLWVYDARRQWVKAKAKLTNDATSDYFSVLQMLHEFKQYMDKVDATISDMREELNILSDAIDQLISHGIDKNMVQQPQNIFTAKPKKAAKR